MSVIELRDIIIQIYDMNNVNGWYQVTICCGNPPYLENK